jgi:hypothetical protein
MLTVQTVLHNTRGAAVIHGCVSYVGESPPIRTIFASRNRGRSAERSATNSLSPCVASIAGKSTVPAMSALGGSRSA